VRVRDHVLLSAAVAALAAPFTGSVGAAGLLAGGVLIDADHHAWYCVTRRSVNPVAAVRFFNEADPPQHAATRVLHNPALLAGMALLGLRFRPLLPVAAGMALHTALDRQHEARMRRARAAALARDGYSCRVCGPGIPAAGAHLFRQPTLLPAYRAQDLISLCGPCHEAAHSPKGGLMAWT
jgi:hypothetical protein